MGAHLPLPLHVAGWVGLLPHLSFHLHPGGDAPHSLAHPYFAGCVAATLVALLIIARVCCCHPCCVTLLLGCVAATLVALLIITRVCRCHPYCLHLQGVLLPPSIYAREHPMSLVPFTAKDCVVCIYYYYVKRQVVNLTLEHQPPLQNGNGHKTHPNSQNKISTMVRLSTTDERCIKKNNCKR